MVNLDKYIFKKLENSFKSFALNKTININSVRMCIILNIFVFQTQYYYVIQLGLEPMILLPLSSKWLGLQVYSSIPRFNCFTNLFIYLCTYYCVCKYTVCSVHTRRPMDSCGVCSLPQPSYEFQGSSSSLQALTTSIFTRGATLLALTCLILYFCFV